MCFLIYVGIVRPFHVAADVGGIDSCIIPRRLGNGIRVSNVDIGRKVLDFRVRIEATALALRCGYRLNRDDIQIDRPT